MSTVNSVEQTRKRVRTGCLTCRRRHRKCDETKPLCLNCQLKSLQCHWRVNGQFSESNSRYLPDGHYSVVPNLCDNDIMIVDERPNIGKYSRYNREESNSTVAKQSAMVGSFSISVPVSSPCAIPVESPMLSPTNSISSTGSLLRSPQMSLSQETGTTSSTTATAMQIGACTPSTSYDNSPSESPEVEISNTRNTVTSSRITPAIRTDSPDEDILTSQSGARRIDISPSVTNISLSTALNNRHTVARRDAIPISHIIGPEVGTTQRSVVRISSLGTTEMDQTTLGRSPASVSISTAANENDFSELSPATESSAYRDLHDTLRDYMFSSAKSAMPSRASSPLAVDTNTTSRSLILQESAVIDCTLSNIDTAELLRNYVDEIASWLDMFDSKRHFAVYLPHLALKSQALFFSLITISSRQIERIKPQYASDVTLELYQRSIQHLLPTVQSKSLETIAACVVLCCLEMMCSSPYNWRRHLEGCAALFVSAGISGFCGGLGQSLFWCFARMDLSCAVIGEESTIIQIPDWLSPGQSCDVAAQLFKSEHTYDMYANYAVFLCSRVTNLIASDSNIPAHEYDCEWKKLWNELRIWAEERPVEMKPLLAFDQQIYEPFPTVLYGNSPAISGNQLYHMACILLMQNKPRLFKIHKSCPTMLWHAKQICAISLSNRHHGCWNNALQPLWIAGRLMSHRSEHIAILELLDKIEKTTGWAMKWRGDDLKAIWGMS
ncbi:hypothetical protein V1525DRAFT_411112 [Lipomyces kononenkoae]|uniref:Uncharacterized protein n=1 Tax=Lipomyces kononenkoae TaxID=34357 RepID=A0ACC3SUG4_LIPKO